MTVTYSQIYNPIFYLVMANGQPAGAAKMYSYLANDHSTPAPFYKDAAGVNQWPNPVIFDDSNGTQGPFYGQDGVLYYVETYDQFGNLLRKYDIQPPEASGGSPVINYYDNENFFLNSDFRYNYYTTLLNTSATTTPILLADGGWYFDKNNATGTDNVQFLPFAPGQTDVANNPLYYLRYTCSSGGTGEIKNVYVRFPDVNTFSGQAISLALDARSSSASTITINYVQNFGTGGSATVTNQLASIVLTSLWDRYEAANLVIPSIAGMTVGAGSYIDIQIRMPADVACVVDLVQGQLELGNTVTQYEYEPEQINNYRTFGANLPRIIPGSLAGQTDYMTPTALPDGTMDYSTGGLPVGASIMWNTETPPPGYLAEDGSSYTIVGPNAQYTRLYNVIGQREGVGADGFFTLTTGAADTILLKSATATATMTPPNVQTSGFTITVFRNGSNLTDFDAYNLNFSSPRVYFVNRSVGAPLAAASAGTIPGLSVVNYQAGTGLLTDNTVFTFPGPGSLTGGEYCLLSSPTINYYFWIEKNGVGTDPMIPGRTGIKVVIDSTFVVDDNGVALAFADAAYGRQIVTIQTLAATGLAGKYFDISGPTTTWRPYFVVNGSGSAPAGGLGIVVFPIAVNASDTAAQVATKTLTALSALQFQVPMCLGYFIRGWDNGAGIDIDAPDRLTTRTVNATLYGGDHVGTLQYTAFQSHTHSYTAPSDTALKAIGGGPAVIMPLPNTLTSYNGGYESRPPNVSKFFCIKY